MSEYAELVKVGGPVTAMAMVFLIYINQKDKREQENSKISQDALKQNTVILERLTTLIDQLIKKNDDDE